MFNKFILIIVLVSAFSGLGTTDAEILKELSKKVKTVEETTECITCLALVNRARAYLDDDKTQNELFQDLLKTCSLFSAIVDEQCVAFVSEYGPAVVKMLDTVVDPQKVCHSIKLCK